MESLPLLFGKSLEKNKTNKCLLIISGGYGNADESYERCPGSFASKTYK